MQLAIPELHRPLVGVRADQQGVLHILMQQRGGELVEADSRQQRLLRLWGDDIVPVDRQGKDGRGIAAHDVGVFFEICFPVRRAKANFGTAKANFTKIDDAV